VPLLHHIAYVRGHSAVSKGGGGNDARSLEPRFDRRGFLKSAGLWWWVLDGPAAKGFASSPHTPIPGSPIIASSIPGWQYGADGAVTAYSGKEELGQGIFHRAANSLVAEELCVAFDIVCT
jgi:hypothetical protein